MKTDDSPRGLLTALGVIHCLLPFVLAGPVLGQSQPDAFKPSVNSTIESIAVQADGKVLIGGSFTLVGGLSRTNIARINADGSVDTNFVFALPMYGRRVAVQPDGKIVVGGIYDPPMHPPAKGVVRFTTNGAVDPTFNCPLFPMPFALALQTDGKVLTGNQTPPYITRFLPDGTPDPDFQSAPDN